MKTSDFDFQLPEELIAQTPLERRDASRLLTLDKGTGADQALPQVVSPIDKEKHFTGPAGGAAADEASCSRTSRKMPW